MKHFLHHIKIKSLKHLPWLLFSLTMLLTIAASLYTHNMAMRENRERFQTLKDTIAESITSRFKFYENTLRQTKAFFMQDGAITNQDFKTYVHNIGLVERFPGMSAIGYVEYVSSSNLRSFINNQRMEGQNEYKVWPLEEERTFYTPVKFIEPFFSNVRQIRGFDMVSNPERRKAMLESAAEGKATVTEEVDLLLNEGASAPQGFNIFIPVYNSDIKPSTREERIEKTQGYVFGIFSAAKVFNIIMMENDFFKEEAAVQVFLGGKDGPTEVYNSARLYGAEEKAKSRFKENAVIKIANKEWIIQVRSLQAFEDKLSNNTRWYVLAMGTLLALAFLFFTRYIQKGKNSLEQSEQKHRKLAQSNWMLAEAGRTLGTSLDTPVLLRRFARFFTENFSDCCIVHLSKSENREELEPSVKVCRDEDAKTSQGTIEHFLNADHIVNYVHREGKAVYHKSSKDLGDKSFISLPMLVRGEAFGVVTLLYNRPKELDEEEMLLLQQAVSAASSSLENSLLYKEAQVSNKLKDEFLATVSHELRTPLMVILGYSKLLLRKALPHDLIKGIQAISTAAENQSALIEDLLDVSAIISGKVKFKPQVVHVPEVVSTALENVKLAVQAKNITLTHDLEEEGQVLGEKVRLQQIVWNLLSNSIKFTPPGGRIDVKTANSSTHTEIIIKDTGKGMEPHFIPHVFEKFRQEEKTSTRSKGGLGLGLSIVASLVELHGGTISAHSEGKDKGSTFTVRFPLMSAQETIEVKAGAQADAHSLKEVRVLVLDDNKDALDIISRILEGYDAEVYSAASVTEALSIMKDKNLDVVISDMAMPERDGLDFIREIRIREQETGTHIPVVVLTAFTEEKDKAEALEKGFDSFIAKPVEPEHLAAVVHEVIHHHGNHLH